MTDLEFKVSNVYPGSPNQRKFGIFATFTLNIVVDGNIVASLADYKLSKNKEGSYYISAPYREYEKKGEEGKKNKIYFSKLFPKDEASRQEVESNIMEQVKRDCESKSNNPSSAPRPTGGTFNKGNTQKPKAPINEAW